MLSTAFSLPSRAFAALGLPSSSPSGATEAVLTILVEAMFSVPPHAATLDCIRGCVEKQLEGTQPINNQAGSTFQLGMLENLVDAVLRVVLELPRHRKAGR